MHMGSGFCLCAGADFLSARGPVNNPTEEAKNKKAATAKQHGPPDPPPQPAGNDGPLLC